MKNPKVYIDCDCALHGVNIFVSDAGTGSKGEWKQKKICIPHIRSERRMFTALGTMGNFRFSFWIIKMEKKQLNI